MTTVVLSLHLLVTIVLIFLILLQKSEGSAGGGFGGGVSLSSMMQPRSRPNALTRATGILALTFFATSMGLALLARETAPTSILAPAATSSGGAVPKVSESILETPAVPSADAPAAATPAVPDAAAPAPAVPKVPN